MAARRLFALDQGFPLPIVDALRAYIHDAELVAVKEIDPRLSIVDDWELLLALHLHERPWDGLITTDSGMINLPRELAVLLQTKLSLVVVAAAGHDAIRATGLVLAHLPWVCARTEPNVPQLWVIRATEKQPEDPWNQFQRMAKHQNRSASDLYSEHRLSDVELATSPFET